MSNLYKTAVVAALDAGRAILDVYGMEDRGIEFKEDDSPLTLADKRAHAIIEKHLARTGLPVLSEEGKHLPHGERKNWTAFWLVDPLDGTREFIKRNGEFTVNIALIEGNDPVFGVIYVPVGDVLYVGSVGGLEVDKLEGDGLEVDGLEVDKLEVDKLGVGGQWARKVKDASKQHFGDDPAQWPGELLPNASHDDFAIVTSRSHLTPETEAFIQELGESGLDPRIIPTGSSLKICLIAEGQADCYPRFGPTFEWDIAAGHAIAQASGASIENLDNGQPLKYNKEDLLNPWFIIQR